MVLLKKISFAVITLFLILTISACSFGEEYITDSKQYRRFDGSQTINYFPENISNYTINDYSYRTYNYFDRCTEIFLDITVSKDEFNKLVNSARRYSKKPVTQKAYYDKDYTEIVFDNYYGINDENAEKNNVGNADIKKVIYNRNKRNIIYVYFKAFDTGVYPLKNVAYFNHFNIKESEYAKHAESYFEDE